MKSSSKRNPGRLVQAVPLVRRSMIDALVMGKKKRMGHGFLDVDVTRARQILRLHKERTGESISFTGFVTVCLAKAIAENKCVQAYRLPFNRMVVFDDVDVAILVERNMDGVKLPTYHIVRAAQGKSALEVHREIRSAQNVDTTHHKGYRRWRTFLKLPSFLRRSAWWLMGKRPTLWKKFAGTVAVTAIGMEGKGWGWAITIPNHTICVTLGGIGEKPGVVDGSVKIREYLSMTISIDHDIVDGAPGARFATRLKELIECAHGLEEQDGQHAARG